MSHRSGYCRSKLCRYYDPHGELQGGKRLITRMITRPIFHLAYLLYNIIIRETLKNNINPQ